MLQTKDYVHFSVNDTEFKGFEKAKKALPGDIVKWNGSFCELVQRKKHMLTGTIEFSSKTKYGITSKGYFMYLFVPFNKSYPSMTVGSSHKDCSRNYIGIAEFDSWERILPRANLVRILGPCGDLDVEAESILLTYHPYKIPKKMELEPESTDFMKRQKCPEQTFNIDPNGCVDIDDVLSIQGNQIWITISDVAERVSYNSPVNVYASTQGQTVYRNGTVVLPMLPKELSEYLCSLHPGESKPGVSLILTCTEHPFTIQSISWKLSVVHNVKSYDYDTFIEKARTDGIYTRFIRGIAEYILGYSTDDPHKWIEAFMLKYNIETAKILKMIGQGILRKHSGANEEKWKLYSEWGLEALASASAEYCDVNDSSPKHIGLGQDAYCHATSPIRRYADLVNQRILKSYIKGTIQDTQTIDIDWLNQRQKNGKRYERDIFFLEHLGDGRLDGIVLEVKQQKIKLWIPSWKRIISWKTDKKIKLGKQIILDYFVNPNTRHWKERIVYRLVD